MKGQVLLTVDGGVFALFTSYMDHGNVATKIRTRFIASFMVADKILFIYFIFFFSLRQSAFFSSTTYNHFNYERNDC